MTISSLLPRAIAAHTYHAGGFCSRALRDTFLLSLGFYDLEDDFASFGGTRYNLREEGEELSLYRKEQET